MALKQTSPAPPKSGIARLVLSLAITALLGFFIYFVGSLWYWETKGPYKNLTQVIDLEEDGDLDVVVSHTRWEEEDISWAGVGRWINQGGGRFVLAPVGDTDHFAGFAAGAGDVDNDGDVDLFVQAGRVYLMENQGGEPGSLLPAGLMDLPDKYHQGYPDMGGSIVMGDLTGDGLVDAFVAGCCYGVDATELAGDIPYNPALSWLWINGGKEQTAQSGRSVRLDILDGIPIRQAALGDLDGDGDLDIYAAVGEPTLGRPDRPGDVILLNDGEGELTAHDRRLGETGSSSAALGDVNGDGRLDALVGSGEGARLWLNQARSAQGDGVVFAQAEQAFERPRTPAELFGAGISAAGQALGLHLSYGSLRVKGIGLADWDGDGDLDALVARAYRAEVWWNDGRGAFSRSDLGFAYPEDSGLAVGDFDGDGDPDAFAAGNADRYQVWLNER